MTLGTHIKSMLVYACLATLFSASAMAMEVAGVKLPDTDRVANQELKLNGAGVRTRVVFKVYVAGLYLTEKKKTAQEVMALKGPKRVSLTLLRQITADTLGQSFLDGINHNSTKAEKIKIIDQMMKFGEMFSKFPDANKGDVITTDWVPGTGTVVHFNGKKIGEFPDIAFYNALLRIWLGDRPADVMLKAQLLGEPIQEAPKRNEY